MEIRRAAKLIGTGALGFVIAALTKVGADKNETLVLVFEDSSAGTLTEQPLAAVALTDGSPAELAILP